MPGLRGWRLSEERLPCITEDPGNKSALRRHQDIFDVVRVKIINEVFAIASSIPILGCLIDG